MHEPMPLHAHPQWSARQIRPLHLLGVLILADVAFCTAHVLWAHETTLSLFRREIDFGQAHRMSFWDHGYGEIWDGLKGVATVGFFAGCFLLRRQPAYLALGVLFALPHLDNLLRFHESVGHYAAPYFEAHPTRGAQIGELAAFALLAAVGLVIFVQAYRWSDPPARTTVVLSLGIMALLAFFAVGVDLVHLAAVTVIDLPMPVDTILTVIEDGGEMMTISLGLAVSYTTFRAASAYPRRRSSLAD